MLGERDQRLLTHSTKMGCDYYEYVSLVVTLQNGSTSSMAYCRNRGYDGDGDDYERYCQEDTVLYKDDGWTIKNKYARIGYTEFIEEDMELDWIDVSKVTKCFQYEER